MSEHTGTCFCGAVEVTLTGAPLAMGYCHCESCRHWSAGPINAFTLWKPENVKVTKGADNLGTYRKTEQSHRRWCKACGGHVLTEHPGMGLSPRIRVIEALEGGRVEPTEQPGVGRIVGATPVRRRTLDPGNALLHYSRGAWLEHLQAIDGASLSYADAKTSAELQQLAKQLFAWIRRWTPESVRVSNANYERRATKGAAAEARADRKFM